MSRLKELPSHIDLEGFNKKGISIGSSKINKKEFFFEVKGALPNERIKPLSCIKRRRTLYIDDFKILKKSNKRTSYPCSHFPKCGGCSFQNFEYLEQLKHKENLIKGLYEHLSPKPIFIPPQPSKNIWNYRNKMDYTFATNRLGEKSLGLFQSASRNVINLKECHISPHWFLEVKNIVFEWWNTSNITAYQPSRNRGSLRNLILRTSTNIEDKMIMLRINADDPLLDKDLDHLSDLLKSFLKEKAFSFILQSQFSKKGEATYFKERVLHGSGFLTEKLVFFDAFYFKYLKLKILPNSFFQPNTHQAQVLYETALTLPHLGKQTLTLDLYCGIGPLGILASKISKKVIGFELISDAVKNAKENLIENNIDNMEVIELDVDNSFLNYPFPQKPSLVIVDPPRAGIGEKTLRALLDLKPNKILYISCNPYTQKSDILQLIENNYDLKLLAPIDQFPHTPHIENIALLTLKNKK